MRKAWSEDRLCEETLEPEFREVDSISEEEFIRLKALSIVDVDGYFVDADGWPVKLPPHTYIRTRTWEAEQA